MRSYARLYAVAFCSSVSVAAFADIMHFQLAIAAARAKARGVINGLEAIRVGSGAPSAATASTSATPSPATSVTPCSTSHSLGSADRIGLWQVPDLFDDGLDAVSDPVKQHRQQVEASVQECFSNELATSTLKTYDSALQEVHEAAEFLQRDLLPMTDEAQFLLCFGHIKTKHAQLKWSKIRTVRAALLHWHHRRHTKCILDNWSPTMAGFWNGLSKSCGHDSVGKQPIPFPDVVQYLHQSAADDAATTIRNAAMVATAFFGVRRGAEVVSFQWRDVQREDSLGLHLKVRCQKNDRVGLGQICLIPEVAGSPTWAPAVAMRRWLGIRGQFVDATDPLKPLFVTTVGKNRGGPVSTDTLRKHVTSAFGNSTATHSLRKGGATYYARQGTPSDATRQQGGWRTTETMTTIYTTLSAQEVGEAIHRTVACSAIALDLRHRIKSLGGSPAELLGTPIHKVIETMELAEKHIYVLDAEGLQTSKVMAFIRFLTKHPTETVRHKAATLLTTIQSSWMALQSAKRQRVA